MAQEIILHEYLQAMRESQEAQEFVSQRWQTGIESLKFVILLNESEYLRWKKVFLIQWQQSVYIRCFMDITAGNLVISLFVLVLPRYGWLY